jgi:hypothetical protein
MAAATVAMWQQSFAEQSAAQTPVLSALLKSNTARVMRNTAPTLVACPTILIIIAAFRHFRENNS